MLVLIFNNLQFIYMLIIL